MRRQSKSPPARARASSERAVADRLHSAAIHLLRRLRRVDQVADIGPARLSALSVIVFGGPVTLTRLAEAEQVTGATISRVVSGLESAGLASRRTDERDRRVTWIEATARGRRLLERGRERRVELLRSRLATLAPDELASLERAAELLERIARAPE